MGYFVRICYVYAKTFLCIARLLTLEMNKTSKIVDYKTGESTKMVIFFLCESTDTKSPEKMQLVDVCIYVFLNGTPSILLHF